MWKTLSFNPLYEANDEFGIVRKNINGKIFYPKPYKDVDGYLTVSLTDGEGNKKKYRVHRIIALTFIPNPENKTEVNHINSVRDDNRVENLEWVTRSENMKHAFREGRWPELREKARENLLSCAVASISVPVAQISLEGEIVGTYKSMAEAERSTGINQRNISRACKKEGTAGGYKWKRFND